MLATRQKEAAMPTLTASSTLTVYGSTSVTAHGLVDSGWSAVASFEQPAEAMAFSARFPKSAGLKVYGATATSRARLTANDLNSGVNEAGVRRYRSLIRRAQRLGVTIKWHDPSTLRAIPVSQEMFEARVFGAGIEPQSAGGKYQLGLAK